jgi:hypothetical protein
MLAANTLGANEACRHKNIALAMSDMRLACFYFLFAHVSESCYTFPRRCGFSGTLGKLMMGQKIEINSLKKADQLAADT